MKVRGQLAGDSSLLLPCGFQEPNGSLGLVASTLSCCAILLALLMVCVCLWCVCVFVVYVLCVDVCVRVYERVCVCLWCV